MNVVDDTEVSSLGLSTNTARLVVGYVIAGIRQPTMWLRQFKRAVMMKYLNSEIIGDIGMVSIFEFAEFDCTSLLPIFITAGNVNLIISVYQSGVYHYFWILQHFRFVYCILYAAKVGIHAWHPSQDAEVLAFPSISYEFHQQRGGSEINNDPECKDTVQESHLLGFQIRSI